MKRRKYLSILIICFISLPLLANLSMTQETDDVNIIFSISFLSPNDSAARCGHWGMLLENTLPKIGIGIDFHESTSWEAIEFRTLGYPYLDFDYIPTYDEGGFDILFNKFTWELDPNLEGMFDTGLPLLWGEGISTNTQIQLMMLNYMNI